MNFQEFRAAMKSFPVFTRCEIQKYFPNFDSRRLVEWQHKGYITKLRNRYYCFADTTIDEHFLYYVSNTIYEPSYLSLETAFSYYGFIPEGVFQLTSCTTRKTKSFQTPVGTFSYRHIKPSLFFGYQLVDWNNYRFAIAEPEKSILDFLYLHSEVKEVVDIHSLRWNPQEIANSINMSKLNTYESHINSPTLSQRVSLLKEYLYANTK